VRVYAAGTTPRGLPYLVMEYLAGPTLAQFLQSRPLEPRQAAELLAQAARGLAAAHAAGLIHRDLKPANLLLEGETGRVKLVDFGLARLAEQPSGLTRESAIAGTPAYMSPEQARGQTELDGRTDVYSLGVTLYETLTGEAPFRGKPHLVLQQILHEEPRPPRRLNDAIPRDLETICLKAMAKEQSRRYPSAAALGDDLGRWLRGEPIQARPIGRAGRLWRWCRRNPVPAGLTAALVLVFLTGFGGMAWQWWRAQAKADEARRDFQRAQDAVNKYLTEVSEDPELKARNLEPLRRRLLQTARDYYETFVREHPDDPNLQAELGRAYGRLGVISGLLESPPAGIPMYEKKRAIFERLHRENPGEAEYQSELAASYWRLGIGYHYAGKLEQAWTSFRRARDLLRELVRTYPDEPEYSARLIRTCNSLGRSYDIGQRRRQAEPVFREGRAAYAEWVRRHSPTAHHQESVAWLLANLGSLYRRTGRAEAAVAPLRQAIQIGRQLARARPGETAGKEVVRHALVELGVTQAARADAGAAEAAFQEAALVAEELLHEHPTNPEYQETVAEVYYHWGAVIQDWRNRPAADARFLRKAAALQNQLVRAYPASWPYRANLIVTYKRLAMTAQDRGDLRGALQFRNRVLTANLRALKTKVFYNKVLGDYYVDRADILRRLRKYPEALADLDRAIRLNRAADRPAFRDLRRLIASHVRLEKGEHVRPAAAARAVAKRSRKDGRRLSGAAAVLSRCAEVAAHDHRLAARVRREVADRYAWGAVALLRRAKAAGSFRLPREQAALKNDPDFAPLRARGDWQKFLEELPQPPVSSPRQPTGR
jgi:serine/threonine-protein kinase